jgi:hypothetical protein
LSIGGHGISSSFFDRVEEKVEIDIVLQHEVFGRMTRHEGRRSRGAAFSTGGLESVEAVDEFFEFGICI